MQYTTLGKTNLSISVLGVGGIPLQRFDAQNAKNIFRTAYENGVNFVDTARGYTVSEELIGEALKDYPRDKFVIATKTKSRTYEAMKKDIEISLHNLQTDYIDLYQCHCVATEEEIETILSENGALRALREAMDEGKIRHIGFSAHKMEMAEKLISLDIFETMQYPFNFIETHAEKVYRMAKEKGMGTIVMKPVGGGAIKHIDLSLRFIGNQEFTDVMIPGVDNEKQLQYNIDVVNKTFSPLDDNEYSIIQQEKELLGNAFCRRCDYCQPCTADIKISNILMLDGYYTRYDLKDWAQERYDKSEKTFKDCVDCGLCEERCPYELPIRTMLKAAEEHMGRN